MLPELLSWFLVCSALTYVITEASIWMKTRAWLASWFMPLCTLLYCRKCMGFWVGLGVGYLGVYPLPLASSMALDIPLAHIAAVESGLAFMALMWVLDKAMPSHPTFAFEQDLIDHYRIGRAKEPWFQ